MPAERYYFDAQLSVGLKFDLLEQEFHHLVHVMRSKVGDIIEIVNGKGALAKSKILEVSKRSVSLIIQEVSQQSEPEVNLILVQGIPRVNRLDTILEKCTELGATEIRLCPTQYSERKHFNEQQIKRFESITIAAMKQSGRLFLPKIQFIAPILEWKETKEKLFFGDLSPHAPLFYRELEKLSKEERGNCLESCLFVVGPEKGLCEEEILHLNQLNGIGVKLHSNTLRTDTAAIAALAIMSQYVF